MARIKPPAMCPARRLQIEIGNRNAEILRILRRAESGRSGSGSLTKAQRSRLSVLRAEVSTLRNGGNVPPIGRRPDGAGEDETGGGPRNQEHGPGA